MEMFRIFMEAKRSGLFCCLNFANGMALIASKASTPAKQLMYCGSICADRPSLFIQDAMGEENNTIVNARTTEELSVGGIPPASLAGDTPPAGGVPPGGGGDADGVLTSAVFTSMAFEHHSPNPAAFSSRAICHEKL